MSDTYTPETERNVSIAEDINKLSAHLGPRNTLDFKTALSCVELYKSTFGDEGLSFLEKKVDLLVNKCLFEKPESEGIQQIGKLVNSLEALKTFQFRGYDDQKGYQSFIEAESKEIAASESSLKNIKDRIESEKTSLERSHFNSKEKIMSDELQDVSDQVDDYLSELKGTQSLTNDEERELSPKEKAFKDAVINASHERKVIADAIKAGTLACLPGKDGYADTTPAVNIMTPNKPYHGENQLFLKAVQKQEQNGFPTAEYITYNQIDKAREEGLDLYIRKDQKGVTLLVGEKKENGEWENKHIKLFNVAQLSNPKLIKEWAETKIEEQAKKDLEYNQTRYGTGYKPPESKPKAPGPDIVCSSTEPEKYIGQYLAAVSMESKFKASPEQAKEFSEKMISALYAPMEPRVNKETGEIKQPPLNKETGKPITDPFSLDKISRKANEYCKEFMRDLRMEMQHQNQPEQKQEQTQSIGRGM